MGPGRIRPGEPTRSARPTDCPGCFNGARANSPWRTPEKLTNFQVDFASLGSGQGEFALENFASGFGATLDTMRLLQWGQGEFALENSAGVVPLRPRSIGEFNRGQGEFALENRTDAGAASAHPGASMGPGRIRPGERSKETERSHPRLCFNGARANSPWRT